MIFAFIVLSILCMSFIFHLRLKSQRLHHLQNFNSVWLVRLALITFAMVWAINEVIRLPFLRRKYQYKFLPFLTLTEQSNLCKIHVVLSFGFLQPGFLIALLFLVNKSIQKQNRYCIWPFASICAMCCPLIILQIFVVSYSPLEDYVPTFMHISSILSSDLNGNKMIFCSYPLFSCIIFAGFAIAYSLAFTLSSWRVMEFVINKSIRGRINVLSFTVMICLPVQILCLGISPLWMPQDPVYCLVALVMFLDVAFCMAVGQIILVLKPIADALAAGGECCSWRPEITLGHDDVLDNGRRGRI
ncbi:hypothetical protein LIER_24233 [Lithospermum erythrorhizon]|uniref:Uncharacterized protein n=1 Tax=Lithospermum erythrorhizon TaxID=34254 RepID=A0AAV3R1U8_LITER